MNRTEYLRGLEHRERLAGMLEMARKTMTPHGFAAFSRGIEYQLRELEDQLSAYERSGSAKFCGWMGMKVYTVSSGPLEEPAKPRIADLLVTVDDSVERKELALCPA